MGKIVIRLVMSAVPLLAGLAPCQGQALNDPVLHVREVVAGLSQPTAMAFIGPGDILVLQKDDGRVRRIIDGVLQPGQVLDVAVDRASERGLLGIAIHPNFPTIPSVYLYYTESSTGSDTSGTPTPLGNRVYRYTWNGSTPVNPTLILNLPVTPGPNHDGGSMAFGPDGKLYVVIGELNRNGQLQNIATGPAPDDTGVILRIDDDGGIPFDNPFFAAGGHLAKYYAYGIRNSFGLVFDPVTGELWDTENGPANYDEINLVERGFNSGWNRIMGPVDRDPEGTSDLVQFPGSHYADPKFSWLTTVAPTAIAFMSSPRLGIKYENDVFVGDVNNGRLYHFRVNATRNGFDFASEGLADLVADSTSELQEVILGTGFGGITDLKIGPEGLLYVLSIGLGKIFVVSRPFSRDFNGDGNADILWRHAAGATSIWLMSGASVIGTGDLGGVPTDWTIQGVGDFNGDGHADILWRHSSGAVYVWFLNGTTVIGSGSVGSAGTDWTVQGVGDFNADGWADILWRQTAGAVVIWLMNGTGIDGATSLGSVDPSWAIQ